MALDYEIDAVRLEPSGDRSHMHVALVGYESPHVTGEPIMIPPERALQKIAFDERFHVVVDGESVEVTGGACPVCGLEPYLRTPKDAGGATVLHTLPQK